MIRRVRLTGGLLAGGLALAGCSSSFGSPDASSATPVPETSRTLVVADLVGPDIPDKTAAAATVKNIVLPYAAAHGAHFLVRPVGPGLAGVSGLRS